MGSLGAPVELFPCELDVTCSSPGSHPYGGNPSPDTLCGDVLCTGLPFYFIILSYICGLIVAKIPPKDQKVDDMAPGSPNGNNNVTSMPKDSELYKAKRIEALRKYEILVEFEKQLIPVFGKHENR
ncbi:hypothetical protein OROGR_029330 [Orobanche gracilis]